MKIPSKQIGLAAVAASLCAVVLVTYAKQPTEADAKLERFIPIGQQSVNPHENLRKPNVMQTQPDCGPKPEPTPPPRPE